MKFTLRSSMKPAGDQPQAIAEMVANLRRGARDQTLLGVTGSGKTFTLANVIAQHRRPTLVISHNKTLAAQLFQEFREFFPENSVHYFVSYYDYYQPEAYIPQTDTYIAKDARINDEIDRLRHAATAAVLTRSDVLVVASVSCIYGIGRPDLYRSAAITLRRGQTIRRSDVARSLSALQFEHSDMELLPGTFRTHGERTQIVLPSGEELIEIEYAPNGIERIVRAPFALERAAGREEESVIIFPTRHFVTDQRRRSSALAAIREELREQSYKLRQQGREFETKRLTQRTTYDLEMMETVGYVTGIENYSRHLDGRSPGEPPSTLIDFFNEAYGDGEWLLAVDESHMTVPQLRGMVEGDRSRKTVLIEHGFRLPSALDNRPLALEEFRAKTGPTVFISATPGPYELQTLKTPVVEQIVRPTGLLDPSVEIRGTHNQLQHLIAEITKRIRRKERAIVTTLTKRLAEELADYLTEHGIAALYLHADITALERPELLKKLRQGDIDVLVGINLLREGLDLPEVSLVAILDADKEGFLRNETTLVQTMGRAARHPRGHVILYADTVTKSMNRAIRETERRRAIQDADNRRRDLTPTAVQKPIRPDLLPVRPSRQRLDREERALVRRILTEEPSKAERQLKSWRAAMRESSRKLDFEYAARLRDRIRAVEQSLKIP